MCAAFLVKRAKPSNHYLSVSGSSKLLSFKAASQSDSHGTPFATVLCGGNPGTNVADSGRIGVHLKVVLRDNSLI